MKKYIFIAVFLVKTIGLTAQTSRFKDGEILNVWATSGLNMRDKPDAKSTKIAAIPYGAKVVVQPNIGIKIPFEVEEFKGFVVKGLWLLVKYGDKEGFVFDGFLSRLPALDKNEKEDLVSYLEKKIGKISDKNTLIWDEATNSSRSAKSNEKYSENSQMIWYNQKFNFNILFEYRQSETTAYTIISSDLTQYEAYMFVKTYFFDAESDIFTFNKKDKSIEMTQKVSSMGCSFSIIKEGNKIIIGGGCGC